MTKITDRRGDTWTQITVNGQPFGFQRDADAFVWPDNPTWEVNVGAIWGLPSLPQEPPTREEVQRRRRSY